MSQTGFSFGATPQATQPTATTGLTFGTPLATQAQPVSTGLTFGAPAAQVQPQITGLTFGQAPAAQTQPSQSTFGFGSAPLNPAPTPLAGQTLPAKPTAQAEISNTTKFETLPDDYKNMIKKIEKMIKQEYQGNEMLLQHSYQPTKGIKVKIAETQQKITSLKISLERDKINIESLKQEVFQALKNAELSTRILDRLKNPNSANFQGSYQVSTTEYFWKLVTSFETRMHTYKQVIEELEKNISSLLNSSTLHPQVIVEIIRSQHESFLAIASHVAYLRQGVKELKDSYLEYRSKYFGDTRNPFVQQEKPKKPVQVAPVTVAAVSQAQATLMQSQQPFQLQTQQPQTQPLQSSLFGGTSFGGTAPLATAPISSGFSLGSSFASPAPTAAPASTAPFGTSSFTSGATTGFGTTFGAPTSTTPAASSFSLGVPQAQTHSGQAGLLFSQSPVGTGSGFLDSGNTKKKKGK